MRLHKLKCCLYRPKEIKNTAKRRSDALKLLDHIRQLSDKESIEEIFDWLATRERDWLSTAKKLNKQLELQPWSATVVECYDVMFAACAYLSRRGCSQVWDGSASGLRNIFETHLAEYRSALANEAERT